MIPEKMLSDEVLQQAAEQYAEAVIASLPASEECNHKFSADFERKMRSLIRGIGTSCYTVTIQDPVFHK